MFQEFCAGVSLLWPLLSRLHAESRRQEAVKINAFNRIADSTLRDRFAEELLLDRSLAPIEKAQFQIQAAARQAQRLAEGIGRYYRHHGLDREQAEQFATQLRYLAVALTQANTLHDLKLIYQATTLLTDQVSGFRHPDKRYSIERGLRLGILNPLNTCIAHYSNFQRRLDLYPSPRTPSSPTTPPGV